MWENKIDIHQITEIRAKTTTYFGVGAINKIHTIADALLGKGVKKVIVVTGKGSHIKTGAWDVVKKALDEKGIGYILYSEITPNPTVDQVDEAAKLALDFGATAVIAIGGGSPIDSAKSVAILMAYPDKTARDIYEFKFAPDKAAPIIAINLTHGTGTEVNRFAVVSIPEKEYKPAIAYDCIYPLFSIDDPALMTQLPAEQTLYVSVDAINHIVEAATTKVTNPFAILLAKETVRLVAKYLPIAKEDPKNLTARYYLLYASLIAGTAFDNGLLHFTHALEHPLSGVKPELAHGLGLSMLLPAVIKQIYPVSGEILADVLSPIIPGLKGTPDEALKAFDEVKSWLKTMGIKSQLKDEGFAESDVEKLTALAFETPSLDLLLSLAPVEATKETVREIYTNSL
ncbi:MAG: iron-containing alcohol dehydrogenase [Clostridia bacterium]|nr:iron-containing alcohol dehydrogenase [Clostridia bacterium]